MPRLCYIEKNLRAPSLALIAQANEIVEEYAADGFTLTLRQLYYQFVARGLIANNDRSYKRLGSVISDGRCAGLIDWDAIEDRTRWLRKNAAWESPEEIVEICARTFNFDMWENQTHRPEVWIEKDALVGAIEGVCNSLEVPHFSCRGYASQSELWRAGRRLRGWNLAGQQPVVIHLGDHDPSGMDMTRDVTDRLSLFAETTVPVVRIALNMPQVEEFNPPPNPAKLTDSRAERYIAEFGDSSWELDALDPKTLSRLITAAVESVRDDEKWAEMIEKRDDARATLQSVSDKWAEVEDFVSE